MRANQLRLLSADGATIVNGWLSSDSSYLAEALSWSGFDSITVDLQHGMFGIDRAIGLLQGISAGPAVPMARCPSLDASVIGQLLDAGAYGMICPSIDTAEQARAFVAACRYPPTGRRSFGPARGLLYGGPDYVRHADETVLVWAMVESAQSLSNLSEILAVPGLDGIFVGPNDLALSLGVSPGTVVPPPEVEVASQDILAAAHAAGRLAGIYSANAAMARRLASLGWDLVTPGSDVAILCQAATDGVAAIRAGTGRAGDASAPPPTSSGGY